MDEHRCDLLSAPPSRAPLTKTAAMAIKHKKRRPNGANPPNTESEEESPPSPSIRDIPDEIVYQISSLLPASAMSSLAHTSRHHLNIVNPLLFRKHLEAVLLGTAKNQPWLLQKAAGYGINP